MSPIEPARPAGRMCPTHHLQVAPDGKCTLCRRAEREPTDPQSSWLGSALLLLGAVVSVLVLVYMFKTKEPAPPPVRSGPTVEQELEKIDKQLKLLRSAKASGDITPQERTQLDVLEARRRILTR